MVDETGLPDAMIEAGHKAYTAWQQSCEPTNQSPGEAIYLAMRAHDPTLEALQQEVERKDAALLAVRRCRSTRGLVNIAKFHEAMTLVEAALQNGASNGR